MTDTPFTSAQPLSGRLALITGAGQGNGRALALGLARAGARVVVTDMNAETVAETARLIEQQGGTAWADDVGAIDLLVNNAGIIIREGSDSPNAEKNWRKTIDVNVHGTFNVTHAFLPALKATQGTIVNIASIAAYAGQGGSLGYSPSKGAIKMLTQSWAAELAKDGVRVNALAPGVIETPMTTATRENPEKLEKFMARIPMGRVGQPDELIGPVVFLASSMSTYVTGVTLAVDGGFLAA
jgi:NAD(P)-dependent dehydrogenase (short-subunit alcohol dehydrogenase family)